MNNPNFSSILDMHSDEITRPKPLPAGTYACTIQGLPRFDKSARKGTPFIEFTLQVIAALDDVDKDALDEMGGFQGKTLRATFYDTPDAGWRLNDFLDNCGIAAGLTRHRVDQTPGCQIGAVVRHRSSEDGQSIFAEFARSVELE